MESINEGGRTIHQYRRPFEKVRTDSTYQHARLYRDVVYLPVRQLSVKWIRSQRPYEPAWSQYIADNFNGDLFEDVVVTLPDEDEMYHIAEGQHRVAAVGIKWGEDELVPCRIVRVKSADEAARIWEQIAGSKKAPRQTDLFNVRVEAGREENVAINEILKNIGPGLSIGKRAKRQTSAVAAVVAVHRMGNHILERTLKVINKTYPDSAAALSSPMIRGMGLFIERHGNEVHLGKVPEVLLRNFPDAQQIVGRAKSDMHADNIPHGVCRTIEYAYNKGRRGKNQKIKIT